MRIEYTVPGFVEYHTVEALADSTGLPWEVVQDHLKGYLEATIEMTLRELRISADEQEHFIAYVMAERKSESDRSRGGASGRRNPVGQTGSCLHYTPKVRPSQSREGQSWLSSSTTCN